MTSVKYHHMYRDPLAGRDPSPFRGAGSLPAQDPFPLGDPSTFSGISHTSLASLKFYYNAK